MNITLAVIGSRTFNNYQLLSDEIDKLASQYSINKIVSGGAIGADTLGETYANINKIPIIIFKPDWKTHGKAAGIIRNTDIINAADVVIAFWDGVSRGTKDSIDKAHKSGKIVVIVEF